MTTMTIQIPDPAARKLRARAQAAGEPVEQLASEMLQASAFGSLHDIAVGMDERFAATGMTDDELAQQLEREDHEARGVPYEE